MPAIYTFGELLVEIMRPKTAQALDQPGSFLGPFPSGAPAIFASTVARLGLRAKIWGGVGQDAFGELLIRRLTHDGVDCTDIVRCSEKSTAVAFVAYEDNGSREFIYHIDDTAADQQVFRPSCDAPQAFHVVGCSLLASRKLEQHILAATAYFRQQGACISFDPNIRPSLLHGRRFADFVEPVLSRCQVLLPGEEELLLCAGSAKDVDSALEHLWRRFTALRVVVVKRGAQGATVYPRGQQPIPIASVTPKALVDPTGAGDYFDAGFMVGYLKLKTLRQAGELAAVMGAANVAAFGPMEARVSPVDDLEDLPAQQ